MSVTPSLTTRIAIGKALGLAIGLIGFFSLPGIYPEATWQLRWGILLWYATLGTFVGVFGVYTRHPILLLPMPWWFRAPVIGGWMNFVLIFFAYREMEAVMAAMFGPGGALESPFWFVAEGAVVGGVIGYFATRFGGAGRATVDAPEYRRHGPRPEREERS